MTHQSLTTRSSLLHAIVRHNPFYLLSATLMLGGCLALTNSLSWSPINAGRLLILIGTLQFYEGILIALGLYLLRRRKLEYDGGTLLVLSAFFLVDVTFLSGEIANVHRSIGLIVNLFLVLLAVAKLAIIFYYLSLPVASLTWVLSIVQTVGLLSMGVLFKRLDSHIGQLPAAVLYAGWWIVALLPVLITFVRPRSDRPVYPKLIQLFLLLPLVSLIAHLSTSNFVFDVRWYNANLAPLMLGLAVAIARADRHVKSLEIRLRSQFILPLAAMILASLSEPHALVFQLGLTWTPLRLTALGTVVVFAHAFWVFRAPVFAVAAAGLLSIGMMGASWSIIRHNLEVVAVWLVAWIDFLRPRTRTHWGVAAVASSFVSLAIGAMISLRKRPPEPAGVPLSGG